MSRSRPKYKWHKDRTAHRLKRAAEIRTMGEIATRRAGKYIARREMNAANNKENI